MTPEEQQQQDMLADNGIPQASQRPFVPGMMPPQPQQQDMPPGPVDPAQSGLPQQPLPVVPPVPTKSVTDRESTFTSTKPHLDPGEKQSMLEGQAAVDERARLALEKGGLEAQAADAKQKADQHKADLLAQHGDDLKRIAQQAEAHMVQREQAFQDASDAYKQAKPTAFWADDTSGKKQFWAGIAMGLGGLAASNTGGRNLAYEQIKGAVDRHDQLEQARISKLKDVRDTAGKEREWELTKKHESLADAAAWKVNALETAAAQLEANVGKLGNPAAINAAKDAAAKLLADSAVTKKQYFGDAKSETKNAVITKTQQIVGGAGGAGADGKISGRDLLNVGKLQDAYNAANELYKSIAADPLATKEYQRNALDWERMQASQKGMVGKNLVPLKQSFGLAPVSPDQNLKTPGAKDIHSKMESMKAALEDLKKATGQGVSGELGTFSGNPKEIAANIKRLRDEIGGRLQQFGENKPNIKGIQTAGTGAAPAAPATSGAGRPYRTASGQVGKLYPDGTFEPDAPAPSKQQATASRLIAARGH